MVHLVHERQASFIQAPFAEGVFLRSRSHILGFTFLLLLRSLILYRFNPAHSFLRLALFPVRGL